LCDRKEASQWVCGNACRGGERRKKELSSLALAISKGKPRPKVETVLKKRVAELAGLRPNLLSFAKESHESWMGKENSRGSRKAFDLLVRRMGTSRKLRGREMHRDVRVIETRKTSGPLSTFNGEKEGTVHEE